MDISIDDIRKRCTEDVFDRGLTYRKEGRVDQLDRFGDTITSAVQGSQPSPYTVEITFGNGIHATCTCPYNWGGDCKHIVAVLLEGNDTAHELDDEKERVEGILQEANSDDLRAFLLSEFETNPDARRRFRMRFEVQETRSIHDYKQEMAQEYHTLNEQGYQYEGPELLMYKDLAEGHRQQGDPLEAATIYRAMIETRIENMDMVQDYQAGDFDREFESLLEYLAAADLSHDERREYIDYFFGRWTSTEGFYPEFRHIFEDGLAKLCSTEDDRRYWVTLIEETVPDELPDNIRESGTSYYAIREQVLTLVDLLEDLDEETHLRELYEQYVLEDPKLCHQYVEWLDRRDERAKALEVAKNGFETFPDERGVRASLADLLEETDPKAFKNHAKTLFLEHGDWDYYSRLKQVCSDDEWEEYVDKFESELYGEVIERGSGDQPFGSVGIAYSSALKLLIELSRREDRLADAFELLILQARDEIPTDDSETVVTSRPQHGLEVLQEYRSDVAEHDPKTFYKTYETLLEPYLDDQTGRDHYRTVVTHLEEMQALGCDAAFEIFVEHLKAKHSNRPAFLDELEKAGL